MTSRSTIILAIWVAALLAAVRYARADSIADRMHQAIALSSIDGDDMKPWHLKLSFQLFDAKGNPTEKGTIEEWWGGPSLRKIVYTSPSFTSTEIWAKDTIYRTKGANRTPRLIDLVLKQVVHPMPNDSEIANVQPTLREHTFGKIKMNCVMMLSARVHDAASQPLGISPTYCFDLDRDLLRLSYPFISESTLRSRIGDFLGHKVAVDQTTGLVTTTVATAHLDTLETMTPTATDFAPSSDLEIKPYHASAVVTAGSLLTGSPPIYPESAKARHVSGHVVLSVIIGQDGRIHSPEVISSPDESLSASAISAVKEWAYKPFLLDGKPIEVDTIITMNFNFGPSF